MKRRSLVAASVALLLNIPVAIHAQEPDPAAFQVTEAVRTLAGCYEVTLGEWQDTSEVRPAPPHEVPDTIRLDTVPALIRGRTRPGQWRLEPKIGMHATEMSGWHLIAGTDSVVVWWGVDFGGQSARLHRDEDRLRGRVFSTVDFVIRGVPDPWRTFRAERIDCVGPEGVPVVAAPGPAER